jgi:oligoribonuclease
MPTDKKAPPVLCWLDLEMTGLDPKTCGIVQAAMILTDVHLKELAPPLELCIWQPPDVLARMCPFVRQMHQKSGLLSQVERSEVSVEDAEREMMELLTRHAPYRTARLCGNSIAQDRAFLQPYMPALDTYLHYRQLDVSTLKELGKYWYGIKYKKPKDGQHTALFDIRQSIAELRYLREHLFKAPSV